MSTLADTGTLLGSTACWTASVRALETRREDRLLNDPWAETLAGEIGAGWMAQRTPDSVTPIILRTRYFDDFLGRIVREEGIRQIVLLGAGLDTRAYRLDWPAQTTVFELEQRQVLERKQAMLDQAGARPACERRAIGADLTRPWREALLNAGFDPSRPSGWLLEGFLFYLANEHISHLIDGATELATAGSWLGFDIINSSMLASPLTRVWVQMQATMGALWIGTMDDPETFLAARGWSAALTQAGEPDAHHGRWTLPVIPVRLPNMPHNWFVTARKR